MVQSLTSVPQEAAAQPRPIAEGSRLESIDVLRGMALCGVLVSNLVEIFRAPWGRAYRVPGSGTIDDVVDFLMATAFQGNTITFTFSAVFGLGMAISAGRISTAGASEYWLLTRKQLLLLALGITHATLIWNGDVLSNYGLVGLAILPFLRCRPRTLLITAAVASLIFCLPIFPVRPSSDSPEVVARTARALEAYQNGGWLDVHAQRISDLHYIWRYGAGRYLVAEFAMFCLGIAVWRSGILQAPEKHLRALRGMAIGGIASLTIIVLLELKVLPTIRELTKYPLPAFISMRLLYHTAFAQLAFAYGAIFILLLRHPWPRSWLLRVAPLGQMTLTNYLTQSVVFGFVFYGYGLGQFGKWPTAITAVCGLAFYVAQVLFSRAWLQRFRFGPVEWLWRTLAYGKVQPFQK